MNLVDSSGWLEYFTDGKHAQIFSSPLNDTDHLLVPTICLYEVYKVVLRERGKNAALQTVAVMQQGVMIELTSDIAIQAAENSMDYKLPMADSIIFTIAQMHNAVLWTLDNDFENLENVKYFKKSVV